MPRTSHSVEIGAPCQVVFDTVHDYQRRLAWDRMLSKATLLAGARTAGLGVRSLCVGTWRSAFLAVETEYVSFEPGRVAAVKLTNRPAFFNSFAATIKHEPLGERRSLTTYIYSFHARPQLLASALEPLMKWMLDREIRARLRALREFLEGTASCGETAPNDASSCQ
jgi:hypothetical protein